MKKIIMTLIIIIIAIYSTMVLADSTGKIIVKIENFKNNSGNVIISLYNSEQGFPEISENAITMLSADINNKEAEVIFENLPYGVYAIAVHHDANKNGKMEKNFLGIPKEGYGFSNNAKGSFGPPSFTDASIKLNSDKTVINIKIQ